MKASTSSTPYDPETLLRNSLEKSGAMQRFKAPGLEIDKPIFYSGLNKATKAGDESILESKFYYELAIHTRRKVKC